MPPGFARKILHALVLFKRQALCRVSPATTVEVNRGFDPLPGRAGVIASDQRRTPPTDAWRWAGNVYGPPEGSPR